MKTVEVFIGADMRCSHRGLVKLAKDNGVHVDDLQPGDAIVYVNMRKNRVKTLSYNGVLSYLNLEGTRRTVDLDALSMIPQALDPRGAMNYKRALFFTLQKK